MKDELLKQIKPLAEQLQTLQEQAERLGIFTGDRELLECAECGLEEDVTADGFLVGRPQLDYQGREDIHAEQILPIYFQISLDLKI